MTIIEFLTFDAAALQDPAIRAQLIVAITAVSAPLLVLGINMFRGMMKTLGEQRIMKKALRAETRYLVSFHDEAWGFWKNRGTRFARHMLPVFVIKLPPLLSSPQVWVDVLGDNETAKYSRLLTNIHHYNQLLKEFEFARSPDSKIRNRIRVSNKFDDIGKNLEELGFSLDPWDADEEE